MTSPPNKMTAAGSASFGYDNNGSLTSKTVGSDVTSYGYNEANQMTGITYPDQSTNSFTYYSSGLRRSKTDSSGTRVYLHDGLNLLGEWDSGGNLQAYWTWGLGLISQRRASTSHWYHFDRMGNVKQLTSSGQTVTDTYDTDAWGANGSSSGSTVNPFRFGGQFAYFTDSDSGLLRLGVRYLDTANGRFTQNDAAATVVLYTFAGNAPSHFADPAGMRHLRPPPLPPQVTPNPFWKPWCWTELNNTLHDAEQDYVDCISKCGNAASVATLVEDAGIGLLFLMNSLAPAGVINPLLLLGLLGLGYAIFAGWYLYFRILSPLCESACSREERETIKAAWVRYDLCSLPARQYRNAQWAAWLRIEKPPYIGPFIPAW